LFLPFVEDVLEKGISKFGEQSKVPDFTIVDQSLTTHDGFFEILSLIQKGKANLQQSGFATVIRKAPQVFQLSDSITPRTFSTSGSTSSRKPIAKSKPSFCYALQLHGGCDVSDCQYCEDSEQACMACKKSGHGAAICPDEDAQRAYFLYRLTPSDRNTWGCHPLYGADAKDLLTAKFSSMSAKNQNQTLQDAVDHCVLWSRKLQSGAKPERQVQYPIRK